LVPPLLSNENHRGSFLRTKIKYTDSLYQLRINTSSFSNFLMSKFGIFFFKTEKKLVEFAVEKKNPKSSQLISQKMAKFGQKKKDTGKDLK
jgi:hypothetical protein